MNPADLTGRWALVARLDGVADDGLDFSPIDPEIDGDGAGCGLRCARPVLNRPGHITPGRFRQVADSGRVTMVWCCSLSGYGRLQDGTAGAWR